MKIKIPLSDIPGYGQTPSSGPPIGGGGGIRNRPTGRGFYGQSLDSVLPSLKKGMFFGGQLDMQIFPKPPVGPGNTPGGDGGQFLQGLPSFQQYWGYGRKKSKVKSKIRRRSKKFGLKKSKTKSKMNLKTKSKMNLKTKSKMNSNINLENHLNYDDLLGGKMICVYIC